MKKILLSVLAAFGISVALPLTVFAYGGNQTNQGSCGNGKQVVNVNYTLVNDYDSGVNGNAWANDTINRHLQVWNVSGNEYCAIVEDQGSFVTFAGDSPNGSGAVAAGVNGRINGGYTTTTFSGDFVGSANYSTHGNLGSFDLACIDAYNCPGAHPTFLSYFSGTPSWDYAWWGWQYQTAQNGTWLNSVDANTGDITS